MPRPKGTASAFDSLSVCLQNPSTRRSHPLGDFRVAQVAQDEVRRVHGEKIPPLIRSHSPIHQLLTSDLRTVLQEIARFMQNQEVTSKRRSRELEGPASWREHRAMMSQHDGRGAARERQVGPPC